MYCVLVRLLCRWAFESNLLALVLARGRTSAAQPLADFDAVQIMHKHACMRIQVFTDYSRFFRGTCSRAQVVTGSRTDDGTPQHGGHQRKQVQIRLTNKTHLLRCFSGLALAETLAARVSTMFRDSSRKGTDQQPAEQRCL